MNKIFLLLLMPLCIFAKVHYAKVEPYASVVLKSAVSGLVTEVALEDEGTMVEGKRVIHLDDKLDRVNLKDAQTNIELLKQMLEINQHIATGLKESMLRQESYYKRISKLSTASKTQKDSAYRAFTSAKTQYLGTQEKIISLKKQLLSMQYKVAQLEDIITKKSVVLRHKYLYRLMVREGDFVAPGSPLAKVQDVSRAKLVLFLDKDEVEGIADKTLYLDDVKSAYKIDKVWRVADEKFISSYRAEIYMDAPEKSFSSLVKVEIK